MDLGPPRGCIPPDVLDEIEMEMASACRLGDLELVDNIWQRSSDDKKDKLARIGFGKAIAHNKVEIFKYINDQCPPTQDEIQAVIRSSLTHMLMVLYEGGWRPSEYHLGTAVKSKETVTWLLDHGAVASSGHALLRAAGFGSTESMEVLIAKGVSVVGSCALHRAAEIPGRIDMMAFLVNAGCDINGHANHERLRKGSPLNYAFFAGNVENARWLLQHGASQPFRPGSKSAIMSFAVHSQFAKANGLIVEFDALLDEFGAF